MFFADLELLKRNDSVTSKARDDCNDASRSQERDVAPFTSFSKKPKEPLKNIELEILVALETQLAICILFIQGSSCSLWTKYDHPLWSL